MGQGCWGPCDPSTLLGRRSRPSAPARLQPALLLVPPGAAQDGLGHVPLRAEAQQATDEARHASAADLVRTHTGMGVVATLKTSWAFEITDRTKIDLESLRPYLPLDAIEKAVRAYVRAGGRELAGCRIFQDKKAMIR